MLTLDKPLSFDWDRGNIKKNLLKNGVTNKECEELFDCADKKILSDKTHSFKEKRYIIIGETYKKRYLHLVFTLRSRKIRVISVRDLNKKEHPLYEKRTKNTKI